MAQTDEVKKTDVAADVDTLSDSHSRYWIVSERTDQTGRKDIYFQPTKAGCPADQQKLKNEVERTLSAIAIIYPASSEAKFNEAFAKLLSLAQVGLVGGNSSVAKDALSSLQNEIVDREAGRVKNTYMLKLGLWALGFLVVTSLLYFVIGRFASCFPASIVAYKNFFVLWAGCMIGAWCSFATRKVALSFFDLPRLEEDMVDPPLRLIFSGLLTFILGLVFTTGFANLIVGTFEGAKLLTDGSVALLLGALSGLAEKALPAAVMQRAQSIFHAQSTPD